MKKKEVIGKEEARRHLWGVVDEIVVQLERMECDDDNAELSESLESLRRLKRLHDRSSNRERFLVQNQIDLMMERNLCAKIRRRIEIYVKEQSVSSDNLERVRDVLENTTPYQQEPASGEGS